ncbi:hypothetical protein NDU88_001457 [Pleurodeles waltl]|uniref:Uncharacterized protein n=1 Tax=Pleurodeles waltl TaxID=8319 RepID=A0AAV7LZN9_PLEWA|nr:hypothetical protein NDU88_001457 [Pleurodeles waltl]
MSRQRGLDVLLQISTVDQAAYSFSGDTVVDAKWVSLPYDVPSYMGECITAGGYRLQRRGGCGEQLGGFLDRQTGKHCLTCIACCLGDVWIHIFNHWVTFAKLYN